VLCYSISGLKKRIQTFWKYRHFDLSLLEIINIINAILGVIFLAYVIHLFTQKEFQLPVNDVEAF